MTRTCDGCGLCCKLFTIEELGKPANVWCTHFEEHKGCRIYNSDQFPEYCEKFQCAWILSEVVPEFLHPKKAKFVMANNSDGDLIVYVDKNYPLAYKEGQAGKWLTLISNILISEQKRTILVIGNKRKLLIGDKI